MLVLICFASDVLEGEGVEKHDIGGTTAIVCGHLGTRVEREGGTQREVLTRRTCMSVALRAGDVEKQRSFVVVDASGLRATAGRETKATAGRRSAGVSKCRRSGIAIFIVFDLGASSSLVSSRLVSIIVVVVVV